MIGKIHGTFEDCAILVIAMIWILCAIVAHILALATEVNNGNH
uniref:Uncharacterized protein n=1 Tax=viral metagenome TaxID=1070528 RepID=A0A6H1Z8F3_9ZZZZ